MGTSSGKPSDYRGNQKDIQLQIQVDKPTLEEIELYLMEDDNTNK